MLSRGGVQYPVDSHARRGVEAGRRADVHLHMEGRCKATWKRESVSPQALVAQLFYFCLSVFLSSPAREVDIRLPGEGNSNSHGARPVHLIITMK